MTTTTPILPPRAGQGLPSALPPRTRLLSKDELESVWSSDDPRVAAQKLVEKYGEDLVKKSIAAINQKRAAVAEERPGGMARMAASFGGTPEAEAQIYKKLGYDVETTPRGLMATTAEGKRAVDPAGFDFPGDIADIAGYVPPTVLGTLGGILGARGGVKGAMAGAGFGEAAGETLRQGIGKWLGAEELDVPSIAEAGVIGAVAEPAAIPVKAAIKKVGAPLRGALTERINRDVIAAAEYLDERLGTSIREKLPLSARTEHRGLQAMEQRVAESPFTTDVYMEQVGRPFEREQQAAFSQLTESAGPQRMYPGGGVSLGEVGRIGRGRGEAGERILAATQETMSARKEQVDQAYDQLREIVDVKAAVDPVEARAAIDRINEMTGSATEFELSADVRGQLAKIGRDINTIETFEQLDNFRKLVGSLLKSNADEFRRTGLDAQMGTLYGALLRDAETVYAEQAGVLGLHVAESARQMAQEGFDLERASINKFLAGDKEEAIIDRLMSGATQPKEVMRFKQRIGALPTQAGLTAVQGGEEAWRYAQAEVIQRLREASIKDGDWHKPMEAALSGARMLSEIKRMGGRDKLAAIFGEEKADDLMTFAGFLKEANTRERYLNASGTGPASEFISTMFELVRRPTVAIGRWLGMHGIARMMTSPSRASRGTRQWLTEGYGQGPRAQNIIESVGRVGARVPVRSYIQQEPGNK